METLSSISTPVYKFAFPVAGVVSSLALALPAVFRSGQALDDLLGAAAIAAFTAVLLFQVADLKRVRLDGGNLLVSNYIREVAVPLTSVTAVYQRNLPVPAVVVIETETDTGFGTRLRFIPHDLSESLGWIAGDGDVVRHLRERMDSPWNEPHA